MHTNLLNPASSGFVKGIRCLRALSGLSYNDLVIAAETEAKQYFASHQPIVRDDPLNNNYAADIGIAGLRP
jgi:hypothetical protein